MQCVSRMISYLVFTYLFPQDTATYLVSINRFESTLKTRGLPSSVWSFRHHPPAHAVRRSDLASGIRLCAEAQTHTPAPVDVQRVSLLCTWSESLNSFVFEPVFCVQAQRAHTNTHVSFLTSSVRIWHLYPGVRIARPHLRVGVRKTVACRSAYASLQMCKKRRLTLKTRFSVELNLFWKRKEGKGEGFPCRVQWLRLHSATESVV